MSVIRKKKTRCLGENNKNTEKSIKKFSYEWLNGF